MAEPEPTLPVRTGDDIHADSYSKGYAAACQNILAIMDRPDYTDTAVRVHCQQQRWAVNRYV